jgi:hypothetical protein
VIVAFPTAVEVAILKIAPHDPGNDPYRELAEELGVPLSTAPRTKPPCCDPLGDPPSTREFWSNWMWPSAGSPAASNRSARGDKPRVPSPCPRRLLTCQCPRSPHDEP